MHGLIVTRIIALVSAAAMPVFVASGISLAEVRVKSTTSYYKVSGTDGKQLHENMISEGGKRIPITHAIAATQYDYDYLEPKIGVKNGKCVIENVDVLLNVEYIFPQWTNRKRGSLQLRGHWDNFSRELKRHEEEHGRIALKGAKELEKEFRKIKGNTALGCRDMGRFAAYRLSAIIRKTRAEQKAFDRREYAGSSKISKLQQKLYDAE